jgi:hypothetical protein
VLDPIDSLGIYLVIYAWIRYHSYLVICAWIRYTHIYAWIRYSPVYL